ncbi:hypothetical protein [Corynebacterium sp.]|uniref:hypothetical protein n=1 Tax=Corynebacterium sp. TaxID=1720 RepID=UPI0027BA9807|nr:hypothetical protein [Corynebacterium sp.]
MSFFEDIAAALDADGIESRVNDDVLFVPITSGVEIQFVEIDPVLPAANVYIAAADVDEDHDGFDAALVSVAFSVDDATAIVAEHIATDQVVTVLRDLLEGRDERISDLEFEHHIIDPGVVVAHVAEDSHLRVSIDLVSGVPTAKLSFITFDSKAFAAAELEDDAPADNPAEPSAVDSDAELDFGAALDFDAEMDFNAALGFDPEMELDEAVFAPGELMHGYEPEILELGSYTDFDRLFDVLSLCAEQAEDWEAQLKPCEGGFEL